MKIVLAVPVHGDTKALFTACGFAMISFTMAQKWVEAKPQIGVAFRQKTDLAGARNELAAQALNEGADYILWMDADQTFPPDALASLLMRHKDIVGANYPRREFPIRPVASANGEPVFSGKAASAELQKVDFTGLGLCLIRRQVFERVPQPWFVGPHEDEHFFNGARAVGFDVWIDHKLSAQVGHITEHVLTFP